MPLGIGYMCPDCLGYGRVFDPYRGDGSYMDCPKCKGLGSVDEPPLPPKRNDEDEPDQE